MSVSPSSPSVKLSPLVQVFVEAELRRIIATQEKLIGTLAKECLKVTEEKETLLSWMAD